MWRKFKQMPSGPTAIAFTALLVALSGTAVALPGKNKVDSGDIKNGQVKSADIGTGQVKGSDLGGNAVSGAKVGDNSLTGADLNESTLGKVPSAGSADTATNATNATNAGNAGTVGGLAPNQLVRGTGAEDLGNIDDFTAPTFTDLISKSVTVPTAGLLLINGAVDFEFDNPPVGTEAVLSTRLAIDGTAASGEYDQRAAPGDDASLALTSARAVSPGTVTVSIQGRQGGDNDVFVKDRNLTVTFVPFGNTGQAGVLGRTRRSGGEGRN